MLADEALCDPETALIMTAPQLAEVALREDTAAALLVEAPTLPLHVVMVAVVATPPRVLRDAATLHQQVAPLAATLHQQVALGAVAASRAVVAAVAASRVVAMAAVAASQAAMAAEEVTVAVAVVTAGADNIVISHSCEII